MKNLYNIITSAYLAGNIACATMPNNEISALVQTPAETKTKKNVEVDPYRGYRATGAAREILKNLAGLITNPPQTEIRY